jgi:hypothetical protein
MNVSKFHFYSYGKVAANKALDSIRIEFWPAEVSTGADGEITDDVQTYEAEGEDSLGGKFKLKADTTITLSATWLPFGNSNRFLPPDVRRGEPVMVFQFADDTDNLYWTDIGDISLRRLETMILAISGCPDEDVKPTAENTYFLELSSHKKAITLHTSQANGEAYSYDFQINGGDGNVVIKDNIGNYISMDSKENHLEMKNADGSIVEITKTKMRLFAADEISMESKVINMHGTEQINTATSTMTTKNDTWTIESKTQHQGDLTEIGMLALQGNMTTAAGGGGSGKATFGADVDVTKGVSVGNTLHAQKVVSDQPIQAPNV